MQVAALEQQLAAAQPLPATALAVPTQQLATMLLEAEHRVEAAEAALAQLSLAYESSRS